MESDISNGLKEARPGVFFSDSAMVTAGPEIVAFLKSAARRSPLKRARLCAHPSPEAEQHDMLVVSLRETYVAPHRHLSKSETLVVVEGAAHAVVFEEDGTPRDVFALGTLSSDGTVFYRMPPKVFHCLIIESEALVFVESTKGPWTPDASQYAPWAPSPEETEAGLRYRDSLAAEIDRLADRTGVV